jgi:RNA polymerase sigma-70 factor, ECF subfamily
VINDAGREAGVQLSGVDRVLVTEEPDDVLVERVRDGDRAAFVALARRYRRPLYNAAYRVLGSEEDACDVTQAVFLRVLERLDQYDPRFKFFSWIYRIALNESLDRLQERSREAPLEDAEEPVGSDDPERAANAGQESRRIQKAMSSLKVNDRAVLTLRHFCDCSYEEIAQIMEVEVKTVKSRLFEARQRLRELLSDLRPVT